MCGTVWKFPHNQVFREVISDHQAVNFVPMEQVGAQSVPCMRWNMSLTFPTGLAALELA